MDRVCYLDNTSPTDYLSGLPTYRIQSTPVSPAFLPPLSLSLSLSASSSLDWHIQFLPVIITDNSCECKISSKRGNFSHGIRFCSYNLTTMRRYNGITHTHTHTHPRHHLPAIINETVAYYNLLNR